MYFPKTEPRVGTNLESEFLLYLMMTARLQRNGETALLLWPKLRPGSNAATPSWKPSAFQRTMWQMGHILLIHSSIDGRLDGFHLLPIANNAAVNMGVQISLWAAAFTPFKYIPKSVIAGSHGNPLFHFFEDLPCCIAAVSFSAFFFLRW